MTTEATWRKSSRSENNANCVELLGTLDQVRDSKNPVETVLRVDAAALIGAIQAGCFDR